MTTPGPTRGSVTPERSLSAQQVRLQGTALRIAGRLRGSRCGNEASSQPGAVFKPEVKLVALEIGFPGPGEVVKAN